MAEAQRDAVDRLGERLESLAAIGFEAARQPNGKRLVSTIKKACKYKLLMVAPNGNRKRYCTQTHGDRSRLKEPSKRKFTRRVALIGLSWPQCVGQLWAANEPRCRSRRLPLTLKSCARAPLRPGGP
jgi:hypothetical protein